MGFSFIAKEDTTISIGDVTIEAEIMHCANGVRFIRSKEHPEILGQTPELLIEHLREKGKLK